MEDEKDIIKIVEAVPPILDFDKLYLHPSRDYEESRVAYIRLKQAHESNLKKETEKLEQDRQTLHSEELRKVAETRHLQSEAERLESEKKYLDDKNQREKETQSASIIKLEKDNVKFIQEKEILQKEIQALKQKTKDYEINIEKSRQDLVVSFFSMGLIGLVLCTIAYFIGNNIGFSKGSHSDLNPLVITLKEKNSNLESELIKSKEEIKSLTPPPAPEIDEEQVIVDIENSYQKIDLLHDQEKENQLYAYYLEDYFLKTNGEKSNFHQFKMMNKDYFLFNATHQQITKIFRDNEKPKSSIDKDSVQTDQENSNDQETGQHVSELKVIDKNTVSIDVERVMYKWERVIDNTSSGSTNNDQNSSISFKNKDTETHYSLTDTWKRVNGKWLLFMTEVKKVSQDSARDSTYTRKCYKITCGDYYTKGVEPFDDAGNAIKECPKCKGYLYFQAR